MFVNSDNFLSLQIFNTRFEFLVNLASRKRWNILKV